MIKTKWWGNIVDIGEDAALLTEKEFSTKAEAEAYAQGVNDLAKIFGADEIEGAIDETEGDEQCH